MRQVLIRALALLKRPLALCGLLPVVIGGSLLVFLPLFGQPGFELGLALALGTGLFGGLVGIAAARLERQLIEGRDPRRPHGAARFDGALTSTFVAFFAALLLELAALLLPFLIATARAAFGTRCDPFANFAFFPWLTLPSAVLAAAAGVFCGLWAKRKRLAFLAYLGLVVLSALWTLGPVYFGPQAFAFNFFGGYFPGPLYDEVLHLRPALGWFRVETLAWAGLLVGFAAMFLRMTDGRLGALPRPRPAPLAVLIVSALAIGWLELSACALGIRSTDSWVAQRLGGRAESPHFVLLYPQEEPRSWVDRSLRDLEFRWSQNAAFLGGGPKEKVRVFVYRSAEEKEALTGASQTQFTQPWRLSIHVNLAAFPDRVLKHELVHAMASSWGSGPFRVTTRFGVPMMAVVEGFAVAGDDPHDSLTLHQWAAALLREHLMPDLTRLFSPTGFYAQAASRAYTAAGSFLRYLGDKYGTEKLEALYAHADFGRVYGRPVGSLVDEWQRFLSTVPLTDGEVHRAFARFRRGSLFSRACAREVAALGEKAQGELGVDPQEALSLYRHAGALEPEEPGFVLGQAEALKRLSQPAEAEKLLAGLEPKLKDAPALFAQVAIARADLLVALGRSSEAEADLRAALMLDPGADLTRTAQVKLAAIEEPRLAPSVRAYFAPVNDELRLWGLQRAVDSAEEQPVAHYLLGRRLALLEVGGPAASQLSQALSLGLTPAITEEAQRLALEAYYLGADCEGVNRLAANLTDPSESLREAAKEWVDRCAFETRTYGQLLAPEGAFR